VFFANSRPKKKSKPIFKLGLPTVARVINVKCEKYSDLKFANVVYYCILQDKVIIIFRIFGWYFCNES
jgi:hypothetical protein